MQWRVTPPTLAVTQHLRGCLGIVVGARSPLLLQRLHAAIGRANLQTLVLPAYPDQLLIDANDPSMLAEVATRANLSLQSDAPAALLTSLPPVDDPCVRRATELPFGAGWRIDKFSPDDLVWRSATLNDIKTASGSLFRFALRHQRQVLYCARGAAFQIPGQVGKYLVLKKSRHQVLRYDRHHCSLTVPASCRPPFLVERALILCSGSPPSYEGGSRGGVLHYAEIPDGIAAIAAALLRQEIQ